MSIFTEEDFNHIWSIIGPQQNRTKCPEWRARGAFDKAKQLIDDGFEGAFVEAGCWKGGISALFGYMCEKEGKGRKTWVFDSFQGMSEAIPQIDGDSAMDPDKQLKDFNLDDFNETCYNLMELQEDTFKVYPGWVDDTMLTGGEELGDIVLLRVDVDWYEPTKVVIETLYSKLMTGGYFVCDDYGYWAGARKACDDYRIEHEIMDKIHQTLPGTSRRKGTEHWWRKGTA
jgi:hypothetical protein